MTLSVAVWNVGYTNPKLSEKVYFCALQRNSMVGVCCSQDVRWRGFCSPMSRADGRRLKLWWYGDEVGGVGGGGSKNGK